MEVIDEVEIHTLMILSRLATVPGRGGSPSTVAGWEQTGGNSTRKTLESDIEGSDIYTIMYIVYILGDIASSTLFWRSSQYSTGW